MLLVSIILQLNRHELLSNPLTSLLLFSHSHTALSVPLGLMEKVLPTGLGAKPVH
jgi:hypothetical protein